MASGARVFPFPPKRGVTLTDDGATFCVFAGHASAVWLCLFDDSDVETRISMTPAGGGHWACFVDGVHPGTRYGFRADGTWAPASGQRYNPDKLLTDPYARAIFGGVHWAPEVFGHVVDDAFSGDANVRDTRDSASSVPRSIVIREDFDWGSDAAPRIPMTDTVLYEMHVKGFSKLNDAVPRNLRGTYAGLANAASIAYLKELGVTSVELLPVHAFVDEPHLVKLGLTNYWGYNTLGFFAPHAAYAAADDAQGAVDEFKGMVKALHEAGLEVILDVVYNHTCEQGGHEGATLSLRGLDNSVAYRLDENGADIDVTGCGNSVDVREPVMMALILDSLRYWITEMHVDGFRFDLAVTLGRADGDDFDPRAALFTAMAADPDISQAKIIAEPWDVGMHGWRTGQFEYPFAEWNDRFRNTVRDFWLTDVARDENGQPGHGVADLATRLAGSQDLFGGPHRSPQSGINFVTAHDGFTLADLTAYDVKHNHENGEDNRDGTTDNRSWNHGVEGPVVESFVGDDSVGGSTENIHPILLRRIRSIHNMLGSLLLSAGVPMLTAGDEVARTQFGNNNAYCQDSLLAWLDWTDDEGAADVLATTQHLTALRRRFTVLRHNGFFPAITQPDEPAIGWFSADGQPMTTEEWQDGSTRTLQAFFDGSRDHEESVLLVLHGGARDQQITLPNNGEWKLEWESSALHPGQVQKRTLGGGDTYDVAGPSFTVFSQKPQQ